MLLSIIFILGAISGSFMNVCIFRLPRNLSVVGPRSKCPSCGKPIRWYDNVPILSFFILGGKCRFCKSRISVRYPVVEILAGVVTVFLYANFGLTPKFFILWYFSGSLIVISFIDFRFYEIPNEITLSGILVGLASSAFYPPLLGETARAAAFLNSLFGVLAGGISVYILGFIGEFIFKREAMGGGDVKLMAMIGAFLGWKLTVFAFFLAPFFGAAAGIILKLREGKDIIPYGPYLSLAAFVAMFWGEEILAKLFLV